MSQAILQIKAVNSAETVTGASRFHLLGVEIDNLTMREAVEQVIMATQAGRQCSIAFVNADCLNLAYTNTSYARILSRQAHVFADGIGVKLAARMSGIDVRDNVNGTDMFPHLCEAAARTNRTVFLLGGQPGIAEKAAESMAHSTPGLKIAGTHHGYFTPEDETEVVCAINDSKADIVLVGLGAPRQELWIHNNLDRLDAKVAIGVGGLFDYFSGRIPRAPLFMRKRGLEWVWRLWQEPKRLARRYLIGNMLFLVRCLADKSQHFAKHRLPELDDAAARTGPRRIAGWSRRFRLFDAGKRATDLAVGILAFIGLSPILLAAALAIRLESPGPVLFSQIRVGRDGRRFRIHKFRSMYIDAEERRARLLAESDRTGSHFKMRSDPRVTRVGRLIRRLSIDELPQLWNVINGTMSLVGPRPNLESEVAEYQVDELARLSAKPGITCTWQVSGRAELPWERQIELDLDYVYRPSLANDLRLLFMTIPAVLTGRGAY